MQAARSCGSGEYLSLVSFRMLNSVHGLEPLPNLARFTNDQTKICPFAAKAQVKGLFWMIG
ncbi:MAG: hypothetical protein ACJA1E_001204 [Paracoccaceae bacterium]|jgi:hypothetical protein